MRACRRQWKIVTWYTVRRVSVTAGHHNTCTQGGAVNHIRKKCQVLQGSAAATRLICAGHVDLV